MSSFVYGDEFFAMHPAIAHVSIEDDEYECTDACTDSDSDDTPF